MPITLTRRFHAVGQGLFCSEHINIDNDNVFNVVYDCGCSNIDAEKKMLDKETDTLPNVVDIMFISHFHDDHIRNIDKIICKKNVKKIVIPYLSPYQLLSSFIFEDTVDHRPPVSYSKYFLFYSVLMQRRLMGNTDYDQENILTDTIREMVWFDAEKMEHYRRIQYEEISYPLTNEPIVIHQHISDYFDVKYIPFNCKREKTKAFVDDFHNTYPELYDEIMGLRLPTIYQQLADSNVRSEIRALYRKYFGDINETSMTVLSVPEIKNGCWKNPIFKCEKDTCPFLLNKNNASKCLMDNCPNCLYTGDYAQDVSALKKYYANYWENIGIIQAPHHGGKKENPIALYDRSGKGFVCIISYGKGNSYGHPHPFSIHAMVKNGCCVQPVYAKNKTKDFSLSIHL